MPTLVSSFFLSVLVTSPPAAPCCSHRGSSSLQHERPEHSCLWPAPVTSLWILQPESFLEAQPPVPVQRPVLGGGAEVHPRSPFTLCLCSPWFPRWQSPGRLLLSHFSPTLWQPMDRSPPGSSCMGFPRQEYLVGCHLLQGIFPTQGSNLHLFMSPALSGRFFSLAPPGKLPIPIPGRSWPGRTWSSVQVWQLKRIPESMLSIHGWLSEKAFTREPEKEKWDGGGR